MIERRGSGWVITSDTLAIGLYPRPSAAGTITIQVIAWPAPTGLRAPCRSRTSCRVTLRPQRSF